MSDTITQINAAECLAVWCEQVAGMTCKDLAATPAEFFTKEYGGKTRTAAALSAELASMLMFATDVVTGAEPQQRELTYTTTDEAIASVTDCASQLANALRSNQDSLGLEFQPPWGGPAMSRYMFAQIMVSHIWYHDGQINYIQCLEGDGEVHWM